MRSLWIWIDFNLCWCIVRFIVHWYCIVYSIWLDLLILYNKLVSYTITCLIMSQNGVFSICVSPKKKKRKLTTYSNTRPNPTWKWSGWVGSGWRVKKLKPDPTQPEHVWLVWFFFPLNPTRAHPYQSSGVNYA